MRWRRLRAPLPLLGKELAELAARRRTYVVRVVYAVLLYAVFGAMASALARQSAHPLAFLGSGKDLLVMLIAVQTMGIGLFLPAMMSGAIASEKERRSMALLMLTDLGPCEILWQKFIGRLVPMLTFLLLALPLLAVCYAFGGVTTDDLVCGIYVLLLTCLEVGALAILCSAFCATTVAAFVAAYLLLAFLWVGWPLLFYLTMDYSGSAEQTAFVFVPYISCYQTSPTQDLGGLVLNTAHLLAMTFVMLVLAYVFTAKRAFVVPRNRLRQFLGLVDAFFSRLNKAFGDVRLIREAATLPGDRPVAWRETTRRSLGKTAYLVRLMVAAEAVVVIGVAGWVVDEPAFGRATGLYAMIFIAWILAVLLVTVVSANTVAAERVRQTLDVLATTPMRGRDIVRQKLSGVWRLIAVLAVPLITLYVVDCFWGFPRYARYGGYYSWREVGWGARLGLMLAATAVFLPLVAWLAMWIGLKVRSRARAITVSLLVLFAWNAGPLLLFILVETATGAGRSMRCLEPGLLVSPAAWVVLVQLGGGLGLLGEGSLAPFVWALAGHAALLLIFRALCLYRADRYLGRAVARSPRLEQLPSFLYPRGDGPGEGPAG